MSVTAEEDSGSVAVPLEQEGDLKMRVYKESDQFHPLKKGIIRINRKFIDYVIVPKNFFRYSEPGIAKISKDVYCFVMIIHP